MENPGWPLGADKIFNFKGRIAWWEGPPFGSGQWHAECRGDMKAFNSILDDFQKLQVKTKRIVIHDGDSDSFWLNPNHEAEKANQSRIDWVFMAWQPENWKR